MHDAGHVPVLLEQTLAMIDPQPGQTILDGTLGRGGHAAAIMHKLGPDGRYIGMDLDAGNLAFAGERLAALPCRFDPVHQNFASASAVLSGLQIDGVDAVLADLGFASNQMDDPQRGFSFRLDGPLDMRLNPELPRTAADLVNQLDEQELADVIFRYGDERQSRRIARKIVDARRHEPILTTSALAELVRAVAGRPGDRSGHKSRPGSKPIDPATRTFMALRIAVNDELEALDQLLEQLPDLIRPGGVAAIISFHSHEDRAVKQAFQKFEQADIAKRLNRKPETASEREATDNPRARSAKLRGLKFRDDMAADDRQSRLEAHTREQALMKHPRGR